MSAGAGVVVVVTLRVGVGVGLLVVESVAVALKLIEAVAEVVPVALGATAVTRSRNPVFPAEAVTEDVKVSTNVFGEAPSTMKGAAELTGFAAATAAGFGDPVHTAKTAPDGRVSVACAPSSSEAAAEKSTACTIAGEYKLKVNTQVEPAA